MGEHILRTVALAGNPNVGKSTLFNRLTGGKQHTGNWTGKTVGTAAGRIRRQPDTLLVDIPGTYSLAARSAEEEAARDFLCFGAHDGIAVVCDAGSLHRSILLALQILECSGRVILCVNLMDEAARQGTGIDTALLSDRLGIPVVGMSAARGEGTEKFLQALDAIPDRAPCPIPLPIAAETALAPLAALLDTRITPLPARWLALQLAIGEESMLRALRVHGIVDPDSDPALAEALSACLRALRRENIDPLTLSDMAAEALGKSADELLRGVVTHSASKQRLAAPDRLLTHRWLALPAMGALLALVLWLTVAGANVPSALLSEWLFALGELLRGALTALGLPAVVISAVVDGVWRTTAWVVAVMLPPMAIFFPLFTLLEDIGLLPRLAFALDGAFRHCGACGKQGLTMCMGLGCNAVGVTGCRIIDSPRERLIAIITNSFMPCNGRFPALILLMGAWFSGQGALSSLRGALMLTCALALATGMTLLGSRLLSATVLRGLPSAFTLELPPYRRPRVGQILWRSLRERTAIVLCRALAVAAPAGLIIWLLANLTVGGSSILSHFSALFDPLGRFFGLDGVILLAFLLGLPANEIVLPIMLMCYAGGGMLAEAGTAEQTRLLLEGAGWTHFTALGVMLFTLMHWPCSTTLLTIRRETGRMKWTLLAAALPTAFGLAACLLLRFIG